MNLRVVPTPIAAPPADLAGAVRAQSGRRLPAGAEAALVAAPGARAGLERLAAGGCLAVTTGQQAGLFTGPLFSVMKGLSAAALAAELSATLGTPIVPVFWVAGDDHDFAEINHCAVIGADGQLVTIVLRERAAEAPMHPAFREPVGPEGAAALAALEAALPPSEFRSGALDWLRRAYLPDRSLAEACAQAMADLLGPFGVVVCRGWHAGVKRAAMPLMLAAAERALELDAALADEARRLGARGVAAPIDVGEGLSLVMVEGRLGRDRLKGEGPGRLAARRSGETFSLDDLAALAGQAPERLSANVLLRGAVEASVFPTVAYLGGPGELAYLAQNEPVFRLLGVPRPAPLPRFSALLVEAKVDKVLEKQHLTLDDLARPEGALAGLVAREALPPEATASLAALREALEQRYDDVLRHAVAVDKTLEKPVLGARNHSLSLAQDIEKKLIGHFKRQQEATLAQVWRARTQVYPGGKPQERVLTVASVLARHGPDALAGLYEAARGHARHLVATLAGS